MNNLIEFDQYISPDGQTYDFNTATDRFLFPVGNLGMAQMEYLTQRGPFQHGVTPLDYFLQPRVVQLLHRRNACGRQRYFDVRADILNILRPNRQSVNSFDTGVLRKIFPDGSVRDLSVLVQEGPTFAPSQSDAWDEWSIQDVIRFIAFDPVFFDPTADEFTFTLSSLNELVFPITFPIEFGSSNIDDTETFTYSGTWLSYPEITIVGPLNVPQIWNSVTGEKIVLDYNIPSGRTVTVTLGYGNKTVVDDLGTNLIGTVTTDSDLATFHVAVAPEAPLGVNTFRVQGSDAEADATSVTISFNRRYIGY